LLLVGCFVPIGCAHADPVARANAAYARGDYVRTVNILTPLALRGNASAQAFLGFLFENGYGAPQVYDAAADLYIQASIQGNPFGQAMLGLMYDKGQGVPQDFILAYKWLNLAAARAPKATAIMFCVFATRWRPKCRPFRSRRGSAWPCCGRWGARRGSTRPFDKGLAPFSKFALASIGPGATGCRNQHDRLT
jgi:hypothetical protein